MTREQDAMTALERALQTATEDDWTPETTAAFAGQLVNALRAAGYEVVRAQAWQPIETQPEDGEYLVYIPTERRSKVQACSARLGGNQKPIRVIGSLFDFDARPATMWRPMVPLPAGSTDAQEPSHD